MDLRVALDYSRSTKAIDNSNFAAGQYFWGFVISPLHRLDGPVVYRYIDLDDSISEFETEAAPEFIPDFGGFPPPVYLAGETLPESSATELAFWSPFESTASVLNGNFAPYPSIDSLLPTGTFPDLGAAADSNSELINLLYGWGDDLFASGTIDGAKVTLEDGEAFDLIFNGPVPFNEVYEYFFNETLYLNAGNDFFVPFINKIKGSNYGDTLVASDFLPTEIFAEGGSDTVTGGAMVDHIFGGSEDDFIAGGLGADVILGQAGNDQIWSNVRGGLGDDGDVGGNKLSGQAGRDILYSGGSAQNAAADTLFGGADQDTFYVDINIDNYDQIDDFEIGEIAYGDFDADLSGKYNIYADNGVTQVSFYSSDGSGAVARFEFNHRIVPAELSVSYSLSGLAVQYVSNEDARYKQLATQIAPILESVACTVAQILIDRATDFANKQIAKAAAAKLLDQVLKSDAATNALVAVIDKYQGTFGTFTASQFENAVDILVGDLTKPLLKLVIDKVNKNSCNSAFDNPALDLAIVLTRPLQVIKPVGVVAQLGPDAHLATIAAIDLYFAAQKGQMIADLPSIADGIVDPVIEIDGNETRFVDDANDLPSDAGGDGTDDSVYTRDSIEDLPENVENVYLEDAEPQANVQNTNQQLNALSNVSGSSVAAPAMIASSLAPGADGLFAKANALDNDMVGNGDGNLLEGRDGNDWMLGMGGSDLLKGGAGADTMDGGVGDDRLEGGLDDDSLDGGDDNDQLFGGGTGADTLLGGRGSDFLFGENGNDQMEGGDGFDLLNGGADDDTLMGGNGNDRLFGNLGNDSLEGEAGNDTLYGGPSGNDILKGGDNDDLLFGETGRDILFGEGGDDTLLGGLNDDTLLGGEGDDSIEGGQGNDQLFGGPTGADTLKGGQGSDFLFAESSDDLLEGGDGFDLMNGGAGDDLMLGGNGGDRLEGNLGEDTLDGGSGDDELFGGNGAFADTLIGGTGDDSLYGEAGSDLFVFEDGFGNDTIYDFDAFDAAEKIDLVAVTAISDFTDLAANHMEDAGADVVITDGVSTITILNAQEANLNADDFVFV